MDKLGLDYIHNIPTTIPMTLTEVNIGSEHLEKMAAHANEGGYLKKAFVPLTSEDIIAIFQACL